VLQALRRNYAGAQAAACVAVGVTLHATCCCALGVQQQLQNNYACSLPLQQHASHRLAPALGACGPTVETVPHSQPH